MTADNEKLAQKLEQFAAMLRSGEWDAGWWSWSPEVCRTSMSVARIDDVPYASKSELGGHKFEFALVKSSKKESD